MVSGAAFRSMSYLPHIDGLRGLAVLVILMFHLDVSLFKGGFVGVDVFFVISGYLITSIIAREMAAATFSFANFYARRIRRIFPALFFMLAVCGAASFLFLVPEDFSAFFKAFRYAAAQLSNFYFVRDTDYFAEGNAHSALLHTWSLGVEEQFYLVWPFLLLFTRKFIGAAKAGWVLGLVAIISLGLSEYLVRTDAMQAFYMLHARAWELAIGGIVALRVLPQVANGKAADAIGVSGIVMVLAASLFLTPDHFPGVKAVLPCFGAAMFIYAAQTQVGFAHRLLSLRPIVWTGLVSYSLYLWHWPLIAFYKSYFGADLGEGVQMAMFVASFLLAFLSYKFIEQPFRRKDASAVKTIACGIVLIVVFVVLSNVLKKQDDADWRMNYAAEESIRSPYPLDKTCSPNGGAYNLDDCVIGPNKDRYDIIIAGDSHAGHHVPAVMKWAEQRGLTVRIYTRWACGAWVQSDAPRYRGGEPDAYCEKMARDFYEILEGENHIRHVFVARYLPEVTDDDIRSFERMAKSGKNIYYLGQVPLLKQDPHKCLMRHSLLLSKWFPKDSSYCFDGDAEFPQGYDQKLQSYREMLNTKGVHYFDPAPYLARRYDGEGRFVYMDSGHLNIYGAGVLAEPLTDFIGERK